MEENTPLEKKKMLIAILAMLLAVPLSLVAVLFYRSYLPRAASDVFTPPFTPPFTPSFTPTVSPNLTITPTPTPLSPPISPITPTATPFSTSSLQ